MTSAAMVLGLVLRVCADPNNLPFSSESQPGFENRIADVIARDVDARIEYNWWSQRKNFVEKTLRAGKCDAILGLPAAFPGVLETRPYYKSTYVFVYRRDRALIETLDDPALRKLRIGVHIVDANLAPPAQLLAQRGIVQNVTGYSLFGAYGEANPPAKIIDAVKNGELDVAIVWGPLGGYFAKRANLQVTPIHDGTLTFEIAMAASTPEMQRKLQRALDRNRTEVRRILDAYGVPRL